MDFGAALLPMLSGDLSLNDALEHALLHLQRFPADSALWFRRLLFPPGHVDDTYSHYW